MSWEPREPVFHITQTDMIGILAILSRALELDDVKEIKHLIRLAKKEFSEEHIYYCDYEE